MRTASTLAVACAGALLALAIFPANSLAVPHPTQSGTAGGRARIAAPAPRRPAGPPVALQLTGLRLGAPISAAAMMHALARDVWPRLSRCVAPAERHGYTNVELRQVGPRRTLSVVTRNGPAARDPALARCIEHAIAPLVVPPYEGPTPEITVSFDLLFNLPAVSPGRRR